MAVVSYRIECDSCPNETVIREENIEESLWSVDAAHEHTGTCPECNPTVNVEEVDEYSKDEREMRFEELDNIGATGAQNLREAGIVTRGDARDASNEEILSIDWVGEKGLRAIRDELR